MADAGVLESAQHVDEGVHLADAVAQLGAEALLRHTLIQTGDVGVGHLGVGGLARLEERAERIDARVGHIHDRGVKLQLAAGGGRRGTVAAGQGVENGGLAAVGYFGPFVVSVLASSVVAR